MDRNIYKDLLSWKSDKKRKPLLIKGARQVGKTYILTAFGKNEFINFHHFDFTKNKELKKIFEGSLDPLEIIKKIKIQYEININPEKDLIIFDEIQECPNALTALKYFCDDLNGSYIISSGSFLGVNLSSEAYPVGKIKTITLYPMSFFEFLEGLEKKLLLNEIIHGIKNNSISLTVHDKTFEYLKYYFITGGLPEVVQTFKDTCSDLANSFLKVRELQAEILDNYLNDMSKHAGKTNAVKIQSVFNNIPIQLARENKFNSKFVFKDVLPGRSNYQHLEDPILWLEKSGLIHKILICKKAELPLKAHTNHNKFKLYLFDIGLLGHMVGLEPKTIYNYSYGSYKGYFAENYVIQELAVSFNKDFYSWQEGTSEIEFLTAIAGEIIPIEVKAGINKKAKSLTVYLSRYHPNKSYLISGDQISLSNSGLSFLPLYATSLFSEI